jgi:hypothetical protein
MRVQLRYQRLPKPRGGWRYPLEFSLGVVYRDDAERESLAYDLSLTLVARRPVDGPPPIGDGRWLSMYTTVRADGTPYWLRLGRTDGHVDLGVRMVVTGQRLSEISATVYLLTAAHRELFIGVLHEWYEQFQAHVRAWWQGEAVPVAGDVSPTLLEYNPEEDLPSAVNGHAVTRVRRVQMPT